MFSFRQCKNLVKFNFQKLILILLFATGLKAGAENIITLSKIGGNLSGITYNYDTHSYFLIQNNYGFIFEYSSDFSQLIRKIHLKNIKDKDLEDIQYLGNSKFAVASENNKVFTFILPNSELEVDLSLPRYQLQEFQLPAPRKKNKGFEGLCYINERKAFGLPQNESGYFLALQEDNPKKIYAFPWIQEGSQFHFEENLAYSQPIKVDVLLKHIMSDLSGCYYSAPEKLIYLLSHESSRIMILDLYGRKVKSINIPAWASQYEGLTITEDGKLILVSEPSKVVIIELQELK